MGNSTVTIQDTLDLIATMGDVSPQANPGAYAQNLILAISDDTMSDLVSERFNFKWNSKNAPPFLTNSWQQDYPQIGIRDIAWIENAIWLDVNSTSLPLPTDEVIAVKAMLRSNSMVAGPPTRISWMYNRQLFYGAWPGAGKVYTPLLGTSPQVANPPMAYKDDNGNILTLTQFGTTGATAPDTPADSPEGTQVIDGTVTWTVCDPDAQGYRIYPLPPSAGPVYQVWPVYQMQSKKFATVDDTLDPLPDDFASNFRVGFKAHSIKYSADPRIRATFPEAQREWLNSIGEATGMGDREAESYRMIPGTQVVQDVWIRRRNPSDPGQPY